MKGIEAIYDDLSHASMVSLVFFFFLRAKMGVRENRAVRKTKEGSPTPSYIF